MDATEIMMMGGGMDDLRSDIQSKVDDHIRSAGMALGTGNLVAAKQHATDALAQNGALVSINAEAFNVNKNLVEQMLMQIRLAEAKNRPLLSGKTKLLIGAILLAGAAYIQRDNIRNLIRNRM